MGDMADWCMQVDEEYEDQYDEVDRMPYGRSPTASWGPGLCPKCGEETELRDGRYGLFYGCSTFPACRGTRKYSEALLAPIETSIQVSLTVRLDPVDPSCCSKTCRFLSEDSIGLGNKYCKLFETDIKALTRCRECFMG